MGVMSFWRKHIPCPFYMPNPGCYSEDLPYTVSSDCKPAVFCTMIMAFYGKSILLLANGLSYEPLVYPSLTPFSTLLSGCWASRLITHLTGSILCWAFRLNTMHCFSDLSWLFHISNIALSRLVLMWPSWERSLWFCSPMRGLSSGYPRQLSRSKTCSSES